MTAQHPISRKEYRSVTEAGQAPILESMSIGHRRGPYERLGKRAFDVFVAGSVLLLASPVLALTWLGLRLTLGPGVVLTQDRVGRNGRPFRMLKFRTMAHDRRSTAWVYFPIMPTDPIAQASYASACAKTSL